MKVHMKVTLDVGDTLEVELQGIPGTIKVDHFEDIQSVSTDIKDLVIHSKDCPYEVLTNMTQTMNYGGHPDEDIQVDKAEDLNLTISPVNQRRIDWIQKYADLLKPFYSEPQMRIKNAQLAYNNCKGALPATVAFSRDTAHWGG